MPAGFLPAVRRPGPGGAVAAGPALAHYVDGCPAPARPASAAMPVIRISTMNKVYILGRPLLVLVFVAVACGPLAPRLAAAPPRVNAVVILADDLGWADLGCYGSRFHRTPNLDKLAASGLRFTDGYAACPVCSPTRAALMTGKVPARLGLTDWLPGRPDRPDQRLLP